MQSGFVTTLVLSVCWPWALRASRPGFQWNLQSLTACFISLPVHRSESRTSMPCWWTSVSVDSRRLTWPMIGSQSLNFQVDAYGHHRPLHWLYHGHAFEPSATVRFPLQQQGHGTVCRRKWHRYEHYSSFKSKLKTYLFKLSFPHSDSVKWLRCCCTMHLKFCIISYHIIWY